MSYRPYQYSCYFEISFYGLFVIGALGVFSVARMRWKIVYQNRLRSQGHV